MKLMASIITSLIICLSIPTNCYSHEPDRKDITIIKKKSNPSNPTRPRVPARANVQGYYSDGRINISFINGEGSATVNVYHENQIITWITADSNSTIEIVTGNALGTYTIEITTSSGGEYIGYFTIE